MTFVISYPPPITAKPIEESRLYMSGGRQKVSCSLEYFSFSLTICIASSSELAIANANPGVQSVQKSSHTYSFNISLLSYNAPSKACTVVGHGIFPLF